MFEGLFESSPDGIVVTDREGRIVAVNATALKMFGHPREALLGRSVDVLVPSSLRAQHAEHRRVFTDTGRPRRMGVVPGLVGVRSDGTEFPVDVNLGFAQLPNGPLVLAVVRDMTEEHRVARSLARMDEQLRHAQRVDAMGRLASGIAHDFNNLLTPILCAAQSIMDDGGDEVVRREDARAILGAAERAAELVQRLLSYTRHRSAESRVVDVNAIVQGCVTILARLLPKDVTLTARLAEGLWLLRADPGQIEQVLVNLVVNARDAMPCGGTIEICTANLDLSPEAPADAVRHVTLAVRDTGSGIPPDVQARMFEPFYTTKGNEQGTGLGLSTVKDIVTRLGGHVQVDSVVDTGSTFTVCLPWVP